MPTYFLTGLHVEGFRGVNNEGNPLRLAFKNDRVNSVFAPNGVGKSSIFDALCYAIHGAIPRFASLHSTERAEDFYCNQFHSTGFGTITLGLTPDDSTTEIRVTVQRAPNGVRTVTSSTNHPDPEGLLGSLVADSTFVDQKTFQSFVEDTPLGRGRSFAGLIGLARLSAIRQVLEVLSNTRTLRTDFQLDVLRANHTAYQREVGQYEATIGQAFSGLTQREMTAESSLESIASQVRDALTRHPLLLTAMGANDVMDVDFDGLRTVIRNAEQSDLRNELTLIIQAISVVRVAPPREDLEKEAEGLEALVRQRDDALLATRGEQFYRVHIELRGLFDGKLWENDSTCPACLDTPKVPVAETNRVVLDQYQAAEAAAQALRLAWQSSICRASIRALEEALPLEIPGSARKAAILDSNISQRGSLEDIREAFQALASLLRVRELKLAELEERRGMLEHSLPPSLVALTRSVEYAAQIVDALKKVVVTTSQAQRVMTKLTRREAWQEFVTRAKDVFAAAEVSLSTRKVQQLESVYCPMYETIMGNPEVVPRLVKSPTSEDLYLRLESFYGKSNVPANTLLSESYRNALAISIFLSAAMHSRGKARFLILDDVTSSFDAGHQFNVMEVLRNVVAYPANPTGPQVIVLSHDGLLQKYFDSLSSEGLWYNQRLKGSAPKGEVFADATDWGRLRQKASSLLAAGETESAAPLIRQYLEQQLLDVITKVKIPVLIDFAIRDDKKLVSHCVNAIKTAVDLENRAGSLVIPASHRHQLDSTHVPSIVGNWISHYETGTLVNFSPAMLQTVLSTIDLVVDVFKYDCICGGPTHRRFYRSLSSKDCGC